MVLSSGFLLAQSSLDSIQHIREVEVTGSRYREVIPAQRLSGEKLEALSSFSVADAIRYFSGVQVKDYGGIGGLKTVDIRSMGTHHMGVFYDGIQLGNAQNGQIDLGKFSLDNIDEISLYNGQKSEIFQSAKDFGSAGTIYLRTRRPKFEQDKTTNLKAVFKTGSFHLLNPSFLWEQKISDNLSSSFNAEYIYSSGKYKFRYRKAYHDGTVAWDTTAVRQNGDIQALRLEGGLSGAMDDGRWNIKAYYYNSERGIPGAIVENVWMRSQRQWDRNFFAQGSFQKDITPKYSLMLNAKYANDHMRYQNPDSTLMLINNYFTQQEIYASFVNKYSILPQWDVSLSVDYQWNALEGILLNKIDSIYPQRHTVLVSAATAFEWGRFKGQASLLGTFVNEHHKRILYDSRKDSSYISYNAAPDKQEYTPALFLSYTPFEKNFNIRAFYKRIFRMPTLNDLYYTDVGNISLRPEYTTQYNLGVQYTYESLMGILRRMTLQADVYYNEITDKIVAIPKGSGQYRWMMMNLGYVEIRGMDIKTQLNWSLPHDIMLQTAFNYTHQRAQDFSNPNDNDPTAGSYGSQIAYIPWHSGSAIVKLDWKSWSMNYSFIYVGERYHNSSNIRDNHEQPWYTHDLSMGRAFDFKKQRLRLSAEVNNLFDQQYDVVYNYPMPGRNYKVVVKWEI